MGAGVAALPKSWVKQYQKYYLLQCFVRGFKYYEGPKMLGQMKVGDMLELVREPENEYDSNAIALHYNKRKIGFIPAEENHLLSKLLDIKAVDFQAEITHLEPEAATWENVSVALFLLKEKGVDLSATHIVALTTLEAPGYYSLKHNNNTVTRFDLEEDDDDYYSFLVKYSANDSIYDYIHSNLDMADEYGIADRMFVVKRQFLNADQAMEETTDAIQHWMNEAEIFFGDEGTLVLSMNDAAKLIPSIKNLAVATTKQGANFIELIL
jgi:hypothetical protein